MNNFINRLIKLFVSPVFQYPTTFVTFSVAFVLPELFSVRGLGSLFLLLPSLGYHLLLSSALSYIFVLTVWIAKTMNHVLANCLLFTSHIFVYLFIIVDLFLYLLFDTHYSFNIFQILDETNARESFEFLETYLLEKKIVIILFILSVCIGFEVILCRYFKKTQFKLPSVIVFCYLLLSLAYFSFNIPCYSLHWKHNYNRIWGNEFRQSLLIEDSFLFKTYQAYIHLLEERTFFERCAESQRDIDATITSNSIQNLVIIIGESFNRHHSSLYGYCQKTNPRLCSLDNLFVFENVISPVNLTSMVFKSFLPMSNSDDSLEWCDTPMFPALFKKAGYNVVFYSNQFVRELNSSHFDASCGFFNHPAIEPALFSYRNDKKYRYDGDLLLDFQEKRMYLEKDSMNLIIFHLYGQHEPAHQRYPKEFGLFQSDDYLFRKELDERQRQEVADYDNATLYNDSIVYRIVDMYKDKDAIVVYFADHGEEANDYRAHVGRTHNLETHGAPGLHCQLDVPFMVHLSEKCTISHPSLIAQLDKAKMQPFMTDDFPHFVLDLAGLRTKYFQPERSPLNESFNAFRDRSIKDYCVSSPVQYDSVCSAFGNWSIGY